MKRDKLSAKISYIKRLQRQIDKETTELKARIEKFNPNG